MLAQFSIGFDLSRWEIWTAPAVGLSSACLLLIAVRMFLQGRKPEAPPAPAKKDAAAEDSGNYPAVGERRASVRRQGYTIQVLIADVNANTEPFSGCVRNRSFGGLCLVVPRAVEANAILSVRTADASAETPPVQVRVKWCRAREGSWELGCQFVRTPPYCQLLLFG